MRTLSAVEAKARFAEALRLAERGEHVMIERHGEEVAALVPVEDVRRLRALRAAGARGTLLGLVGLPGMEELATAADEIVSSRGPTRAVAVPG